MTKTKLFLIALMMFGIFLVVPTASAYTYYGDTYNSYSYNSQKVSGDAYSQNVKTVNYDKDSYTIDRGNYKEKFTTVTRTVRERETPTYHYNHYNSWRPAKIIGERYYYPSNNQYVNTYNTPYYYQPRWDSYNQHYNWHSQ